jgi:hypothetical protein
MASTLRTKYYYFIALGELGALGGLSQIYLTTEDTETSEFRTRARRNLVSSVLVILCHK